MVKCGGCGKFLSSSEAANCSKCRCWYHRACVGLPNAGLIATPWHCPECKKNTIRDNRTDTPVRGRTAPVLEEAQMDTSPINTTALDATQELNLDILRAELSLFKEDFLRTVKNEFQLLRDDLSDLRSSLNGTNDRMSLLEERVALMEAKLAEPQSSQSLEVDGLISQLRSEINDRDQELLCNDLQISNVPEISGENPTHTVMLVASKIGVNIEARDIVSAERVGGSRINATQAAGPVETRPRFLVVRLARRDLRDELLEGARTRRGMTTADLGLPGPAKRFYVNERLTKINHLWNFFKQVQIASLARGGVIQGRAFFHTFYVVTDPDDALTVTNACLRKPYFYDFTKEQFKNGLVTAEPSIWKVHRKLLNPAFSQQVLNTFVNEMNVQAQSLVNQLSSKMGKDPFDVRQCFVKYTLSTVTRTSLGLDTQDQTIIVTEYAKAVDDLFSLYSDRLSKVWLHLPIIFNWSAMKRKQNVLLKKVKNILDTVIRKRRSELKTSIMYDDSTPDKFKAILNQMLQMAAEQNAFTNDEIREHLDTLVSAAYDTTSSALTLILITLGSHRDLQERVYNEVQEVLENKDELTKEDLPKLVLLDAVIKEVVRLYPGASLFARKVDKDVKLKNCTLRAGSTCAIGVFGLNRHPLWGADADQFRPERWLEPASLPDHPSLFATFGIGKRNCIGKVYSLMMMKIALAHILRHYYITGDINNLVCAYDVILKPVEGHLISLTLRT